MAQPQIQNLRKLINPALQIPRSFIKFHGKNGFLVSLDSLDSQNTNLTKTTKPTTIGAIIFPCCHILLTPPATANGIKIQPKPTTKNTNPITSKFQNNYSKNPKMPNS